MSSRIWSREDLRNILMAIYAARIPSEAPPPAAAERLYRWGCRAAIQSLLLAFGLPLQLLDQAAQYPRQILPSSTAATDHWWLEDLEHIIAAVYRSAISTPIDDPDAPSIEPYRQGFGEVIAGLLQAIGSQQEPHHWLEQTLADRYWVFVSDQNTSPRLIGSQVRVKDTSPSEEA
jgi:hypothetical protein